MIPHNRPTLDLQDAASVQQVLRGGQIAMGPRVSAFEAAFAARQGVPAAAVSSGTAALHLSLLALGVTAHGSRSGGRGNGLSGLARLR